MISTLYLCLEDAVVRTVLSEMPFFHTRTTIIINTPDKIRTPDRIRKISLLFLVIQVALPRHRRKFGWRYLNLRHYVVSFRCMVPIDLPAHRKLTHCLNMRLSSIQPRLLFSTSRISPFRTLPSSMFSGG